MQESPSWEAYRFHSIKAWTACASRGMCCPHNSVMLPVNTFQINKRLVTTWQSRNRMQCQFWTFFMSLFMESYSYITLLALAFILCIQFHVVRQWTKFCQSCRGSTSCVPRSRNFISCVSRCPLHVYQLHRKIWLYKTSNNWKVLTQCDCTLIYTQFDARI